MSREEAFEALYNGYKITHSYFSEGEYYKLINDKIIAEDGVNHTAVFWSLEGNNWRANGWEIF